MWAGVQRAAGRCRKGFLWPVQGGGARVWGEGAWRHQAKECGLNRLVGKEPPGSFKKRKDGVGVMFLEGVSVSKAPSGGHVVGVGWGPTEDRGTGTVGNGVSG